MSLKVTEFDPAGSLTGAEIFGIIQAGLNARATLNQILTFAGNSFLENTNNLSDLTNISTAITNLGLLQLVAFFFTTTPTASEVLAIYPAVRAFTIPANLVGSQVKKGVGGVNPAATFALDIRLNGTTIATVSISTGGVVTLTTTSGTAKAIVAGDVLTFIGPASPDASIANWTVNIKGTL